MNAAGVQPQLWLLPSRLRQRTRSPAPPDGAMRTGVVARLEQLAPDADGLRARAAYPQNRKSELHL
jgi:hypothetical protein